MNITATSTVRDLAAGVPGATRVFENFGIDYCCGGRRTLTAACREQYRARKQAVDLWEGRLLTRAVLIVRSLISRRGRKLINSLGVDDEKAFHT